MKGYLTHTEKAEAKTILNALAPTKWQKRRGLKLWVFATNRRNARAVGKVDDLTDDELEFGFNHVKGMFLKELETIMLK